MTHDHHSNARVRRGLALLALLAIFSGSFIAPSYARSFNQVMYFQTSSDPALAGAWAVNEALPNGEGASQPAKSLLFLSPPLKETTPFEDIRVNFYHWIPQQCTAVPTSCEFSKWDETTNSTIYNIKMNVTFYAYDPNMNLVLNQTSREWTEYGFGQYHNFYSIVSVFFGYPGITLPRGDRFALSVSIVNGSQALEAYWGSPRYPSSISVSGVWYPSTDSYLIISIVVLPLALAVFAVPMVAIVIVAARRREILRRTGPEGTR